MKEPKITVGQDLLQLISELDVFKAVDLHPNLTQ